jgi:hypothetical protein
MIASTGMIASLDDFVLTVRDTAAAIAFYEALGMQARTYPAPKGDRTSLHFGRQKINLQPLGPLPGMHAGVRAGVQNAL